MHSSSPAFGSTSGLSTCQQPAQQTVGSAGPVHVPGALPVGPLRRAASQVGSALEWLLGGVSVVLFLALLATYPLLQMLSLGYLLEAGGRVARSGRLRDGLIGYRKAARLGSVLLGVWLLLLPLRLVSSLAESARLIESGSRADRGWSTALLVLTCLVIVHAIGACWRGGKLRHFLWPAPLKLAREITRGGAYGRARDAVCQFVAELHLPHYFWLGLRGFVGGLLWLLVPITLLAAASKAPLLGFVGGLLLAAVLVHLPFLQMRFAAENRLAGLFEVRSVRALFHRALGPLPLRC